MFGQGDRGRPKMTAGEAIDVIKALRPGAFDNQAHEEQVHDFARSAWGSAISRLNKMFRPAAQSSSAQPSLRHGRMVRQPGDGSCLFHSLVFGLGQGTASTLRAEVCSFMERSPDFLIEGTSLAD